jgi:endonuclease/exonuclease/phosphatase family metal-dependent hydrolase
LWVFLVLGAGLGPAACGNGGSGGGAVPTGDAGPGLPDSQPQGDGGGTEDGAQPPPDSGGSDTGGGGSYDGGPGNANIRIVSANLTSGGSQSYTPGEGIRILQGIKPDVVLLQEFNYATNSDADLRQMVDTAFGASFSYFRETGAQIPNGVVSRWPIIKSGTWTDPQVNNRAFAYAKLQIPGAIPLWAISMHLLTSNATSRNLEAEAVLAQVKATIPPGDYIVIGGDFNTDNRTELCIATFSAIVSTAAPYPVDQANNDSTSGTRTKPHDWVLPSPGLFALQVPTVIGAASFPAGLVFDSRVYTPLTDVAPVLATDSAASNMQHMAVIKDFHIP